MLIQLAVENFLSFREKTVLSMRAASNVPRGPDVRDVSGDVLRCAAVYGANASGKSNLVAAIRFARVLVHHGVGDNAKIPTKPYRLDPTVEKSPTRLEFYVRSGTGRIYGYGFAVTSDRVLGEWLSEIRGAHEVRLFERTAQTFEFSDELFAEPRGEASRALLHAVAPGVRHTHLLLRTAQELKLDRFPTPIQEVVTWFTATLSIISPRDIAPLHVTVDLSPGFRTFLGEVLAATDTGIAGLSSMRRELPEDEHHPSFDAFAAPALILGEESFFVHGEEMDRACYVRAADGRRYQIELRLDHRASNDTSVQFGLRDESDGTVRLLDLAQLLYVTQISGPHVFVVDELERSMHTLLSRWFIEQFLARSGDTSQLIFTTHDTNLLDLKNLRPDSIWFAEKDRAGASSLHSLAEYKQEQLDALCGHIEEGYLMGRFGAIPFLGDPQRLGWPPKDQP